jgi:hypothetical protein
MKELNNVIAAILMEEAVLSHSFPQPLEQLLAAELLATKQQEEKLHVGQRR